MQNTFPQPELPQLSQAERDQLLVEWQQAKKTLDAAKEKELELRKRIVEETDLFDPTKETGTQTVQLGQGWKVKATKGLNYNVANKEGETFTVLAELDKMGNELISHIAKELFSFKPEVRKTKLKELAEISPDAHRLVESVITTKPATPSLELIPPKSED